MERLVDLQLLYLKHFCLLCQINEYLILYFFKSTGKSLKQYFSLFINAIEICSGMDHGLLV